MRGLNVGIVEVNSKDIVNGTAKPCRNDEGFLIMGMKHFLLNKDSLEFLTLIY